jgi:serine/threonine-protein kinase HipA
VVWAYALKMVRLRAPRHVGHNPLGAWAVLALIALTTLTGVSGWLIADGDMHLKNLAILKTAEAGAKAFTSVRFAPLYDAVTTRVFPGLGSDRMALKLNGKDDRLRRADFLGLARTMGLAAKDAEAGLDALITGLTERLVTLQLPTFAAALDGARTMHRKVGAIVAARCAALAANSRSD